VLIQDHVLKLDTGLVENGNMIKLTEILQDILAEKKLCKKGKAYYNRRRAAGEKPSAYLSGRAVKVCKG